MVRGDHRPVAEANRVEETEIEVSCWGAIERQDRVSDDDELEENLSQ